MTTMLTSGFLFSFPITGGIRQNSKNSVYKYQYGAIGSIRSVFKKGGAALFTSVANTFFNKSVIVENVTYGTPNARAFFLICTADLRQEISDVGQQTTAVLCTEDIAKVLHRISEISDGVLHGAELVH